MKSIAKFLYSCVFGAAIRYDPGIEISPGSFVWETSVAMPRRLIACCCVQQLRHNAGRSHVGRHWTIPRYDTHGGQKPYFLECPYRRECWRYSEMVFAKVFRRFITLKIQMQLLRSI